MPRASLRIVRWLLLVLTFSSTLTLGAAPLAEPTAPKGTTPAEVVRKELDKSVSIEISDQPLTLAMNQLRDQSKVNIVVDKFTLMQMGIDPEQMPVSANLKDVKLRSALRTILTPHNLSFAVVGDTLLVSTDDACMHRQMRQRVNVDVEKGDLATTLRKLARETGTNLIIDPKVNKEAAAPVTMQLDDVPLDTAVRLMTAMAGLKVVRIGNVMFVCSKEQAAELRQDPDLMGPGGGNPPPPQEELKKAIQFWQIAPQAMPAQPIIPLGGPLPPNPR
jgi:type II secretory pathway component HofQ